MFFSSFNWCNIYIYVKLLITISLSCALHLVMCINRTGQRWPPTQTNDNCSSSAYMKKFSGVWVYLPVIWPTEYAQSSFPCWAHQQVLQIQNIHGLKIQNRISYNWARSPFKVTSEQFYRKVAYGKNAFWAALEFFAAILRVTTTPYESKAERLCCIQFYPVLLIHHCI